MAYLHCHTKGCHWEQDDFWTKRYNPITKTWADIKWLARPRIVEIDKEAYGISPIFSWHALALEVAKEIRCVRRMKWWTYKSWKKNKDSAVCPNCGLRDFDID